MYKDKDKRKQRQANPKAVVASVMNISLAQQQIAKIITPQYLKIKHKKDLRSLTGTEVIELETIKFAILCDIDPATIPSNDIILKSYATQPSVPSEVYNLYEVELVNLDNPTLYALRQLQIACYLEIYNVQDSD